MKYLFLKSVILLLGTSLLFTTCKKDKKEEPTPSDPTKTSITLSGSVVNINSTPMYGVTVKIGTNTTTTKNDGSFYFSNITVPSSRFVVEFSSPGYFTLVRSAVPTAGEKYDIEVGLISETDPTYAASTSFASNIAGNLTMTNGCVIDFPANGFINSSGNLYSGTVYVKAAYLDPSMDNYPMFVFGGDLYGKDSTGTEVMINPYSGLNVILTDGTNGLQLDTANNVTAQVQFNIPATMQASAPNTIELFDFDENQGIAYANGAANKTGGKYMGQVQHFSFWNCAEYNPGKALISGYVTDANGIPVPGVPVRVGHTFAKTNIDGYYHKIVPTGVSITVGIFPTFLGNIITPQVVSPLTDGGTANIDIVVPALKKVFGRIVNCAGGPIPAKVMLSWYSNTVFHDVHMSCFTRPDGTFDLLTEPSITSANLHVWSLNTDSIYYVYPSTNPFDLGDVTICPPIQTGPNQMTLSGGMFTTPTTLTNFNSSKVATMIFDTAGVAKHISVTAYGADGDFYIQTNGVTAGTYTIGVKSSPTLVSIYLFNPTWQDSLSTGTVKITKLGSVGGLVEGTFTGTSSTGVSVTGQFSTVRGQNQYN